MKFIYFIKFSVFLFFLFISNIAYSQFCCCNGGCVPNNFFPGNDCDAWCALIGATNTGAAAGYTDAVCTGSPCGIMPIEMSYFRVKQHKDHVKVLWGSSSEINNKGFEIQRMSGIELKWEVIGFVEGYGNSSSERDYSFEDVSPPPGTNYFRIKQIDFDGTISYSPVVSTKSSVFNEINVWPTLAKDYIILQGIVLENESAEITIYDFTGRLALNQTIHSNIIQISDLRRGHYIINITHGGQIYALRFMKVE